MQGGCNKDDSEETKDNSKETEDNEEGRSRQGKAGRTRGQGHAGRGGGDRRERVKDGQKKGDHEDGLDKYEDDGNGWSNKATSR